MIQKTKLKKGKYILPNWDYITTFPERYRRNMSTSRHKQMLVAMLKKWQFKI